MQEICPFGDIQALLTCLIEATLPVRLSGAYSITHWRNPCAAARGRKLKLENRGQRTQKVNPRCTICGAPPAHMMIGTFLVVNDGYARQWVPITLVSGYLLRSSVGTYYGWFSYIAANSHVVVNCSYWCFTPGSLSDRPTEEQIWNGSGSQEGIYMSVFVSQRWRISVRATSFDLVRLLVARESWYA